MLIFTDSDSISNFNEQVKCPNQNPNRLGYRSFYSSTKKNRNPRGALSNALTAVDKKELER